MAQAQQSNILVDRSGWWSPALLVGLVGVGASGVGFLVIGYPLLALALAFLIGWAVSPPRPWKLLVLAVVVMLPVLGVPTTGPNPFVIAGAALILATVVLAVVQWAQDR